MIYLSFVRSLLAAMVYPVFTLSYSLIVLLTNLIFARRDFDDRLIQSWARNSLRLFGVQVEVHGLENFQLPSGAVILFNHTSNFDILAMSSVLPGLRYGAKIQLFKIPFFGTAMKRVGILPIDRERRETVMEVYNDSMNRLREGEKIALAPEGTRQEDESKLGRFKAGPFVFAIQAQVALVPVVILGAGPIMNKNSFIPNSTNWKRTVNVYVLPALSTDGMTKDDRSRLQAMSFESMQGIINDKLKS